MNYLKEVWAARGLLFNLTAREVRGKYKRTLLGQLWSLANPLALMLIYSFVFGFIFRANPPAGNPSGLDTYALWLLCGLLPWTFFASVLSASSSVLIQNENLIQKAPFSRIVLPLSVVGASAYTWLFEVAVLVVVVSVAGAFVLPWLPLVLPAMLLLAVFATGLGLLLSIATVHFRDVQYLLGILLQLWIYLTPIIYPIQLVSQQSAGLGGLVGTPVTLYDLYNLNPMVHFVNLFHALIYDNRWPDATQWLICTGCALVSIVVGSVVFRRSERGLAEAL